MEWELSKENVQPMKSGRNVEVLNDALKAKAEGNARVNIFENQRRQMLDAIENYSGDDPLLPWIRCIKWVKDAFPVGGAQSELLKLLEECTRKFYKDELYRNDVRYLRVWVQYADCCTDPTDVFAFLEANDIGQTYALYYEAYATSMEVRRNFKKADEIYRIGISRLAQPLGRLENMYKNFLNRMVRRGERKIREEQQQIAAAENEALFRAFGPTSHTSGSSEQQHGTDRGRQTSMQPSNSRANKPKSAKLSVFVDPEFGVPRNNSAQDLSGEDPGPSSNQTAAWWHLPGEADRKKENVQQPTKWTEAKIKQKIPFSNGQQAGLDVYVDEEFSEASNLQVQPRHVKPAAPPILKLRLEDMQSMKRTSPRLKGSFLDFAFTALESANKRPESPGVLAGQEGANHPKLSLPSVLAYDTNMINENGEEKCFEEVRLKVWRESRKGHVDLDPVNAPENCREEILQPLSGVQDSEGPVTAKEASSAPPTPMMIEKNKEITQRAGDRSPNDAPFVQGDEIIDQPERNDLVDHLIDASASGSAPTGTNSTNVSEQRPERSLSQSEGSSGRPSNASNFFSVQGEETIAIKRFAEEIIVLGADPRVNSIDAGSHNGLVEPTINTKECLADILDMFNKPLESDNSRSKARVSKDSKKRSSKSSAFEIFVDDDLQNQRPMEPYKNEKRVKASASKSALPGDSQASGFEVFEDENLGYERPSSRKEDVANTNVSINMSKKFEPGSSKFQIFEDEKFAVQPARPKQSQRRTDMLKPSANRPNNFQIFVDDDFFDSKPVQSGKRVEKPSLAKLDDLVYGRSTFKVLEDEDLMMKLPKPKLTETRGKPSATPSLGVFVDEEFQCLSINARQSKEKSFDTRPQDKPVPPEDEENLAGPYQEGEASVSVENSSLLPAPVCVMDQALEQSTVAALETSGSCKPLAVNSTCIPNVADTVPLTPGVPVEVEERTDAALALENVDPWDERTVNVILSQIHSSLFDYEGFFESNTKYSGPLPTSSVRASNGRNKVIELGSSTYRLKGCIGEGAFAHVFEAEDVDDDYFDDPPKIAMKFQKPACPWEFYIYRQLDRRISKDDRRYYGYARRMHLYTNCSFMICDYGEKGTLQDVINAYLASNTSMEEPLCMFYTIELLRMLEVLHSSGIIHGDIKPDNFLIRDQDDSVDLDDWGPEHPGCWKSQGLCLIDWGRCIDLTLFPEGTVFQGDCKTDSFRCPEMLERRPWTFQVDTFGLCGVVHCLLHRSYMQVEKVQTAEGHTLYRPKAAFKRYWNVLWKELFDTLLNVKDFRDRELLPRLRQRFESHLVEKNLGKKVKVLLSKQNIMMFTSTRR